MAWKILKSFQESKRKISMGVLPHFRSKPVEVQLMYVIKKKGLGDAGVIREVPVILLCCNCNADFILLPKSIVA